MNKLHILLYVAGAVLVALAANSISAIWAGKENKMTLWLLAVIAIAPLVFITFGLVTSKLGLAVGAATVDSLLVISTVLVGLFLFREHNTFSLYQYIGVSLAVLGIILMQVNH